MKSTPIEKLHDHPELAAMLPPLPPDEYEALKEDIRENGILTPVLITDRREGEWVIIDGHHRVKAARELAGEVARLAMVPTTLLIGMTEERQIERGLKANTARRQLTNEQKRTLAVTLLKKWSDHSDRSIALLIGISHPTVSAVRSELVKAGDVENFSTRKDAKGRQQASTKPRLTDSGKKLKNYLKGKTDELPTVNLKSEEYRRQQQAQVVERGGWVSAADEAIETQRQREAELLDTAVSLTAQNFESRAKEQAALNLAEPAPAVENRAPVDSEAAKAGSVSADQVWEWLRSLPSRVHLTDVSDADFRCAVRRLSSSERARVLGVHEFLTKHLDAVKAAA